MSFQFFLRRETKCNPRANKEPRLQGKQKYLNLFSLSNNKKYTFLCD